MNQSIQLLHKALAQQPSQAFWCEQLGVSRSALSVAKLRGALSPTIAGNLARLLGEPIEHWVTVAALEGEKPSAGRTKLQRMIAELRI